MWLLNSYQYFKIFSIASNSSDVKGLALTIFVFSVICEAFEAPISTEVTSPSRSTQERAICARVCPRFAAISFKALICERRFADKASSFKKRPSVRIRLSSGMPCRYLSVKSPCANGQKAMMPMPFWAA